MNSSLFQQGRHMLPDIDTLGYIQCVTCGKMLGNLYNKADELRRKNLSEMEVYENLGLKRTCCRYHLTLGIKMPMVKYLDENVRLDLDLNEEDRNTDRITDRTTERTTTGISKEQESSEKDKVNGIKSRLAKLRDASNQVMGKDQHSTLQESKPVVSSRKISMFVAT
jgi:DNA-directed RNA polymerase subunit N (RpoN/RPB10)